LCQPLPLVSLPLTSLRTTDLRNYLLLVQLALIEMEEIASTHWEKTSLVGYRHHSSALTHAFTERRFFPQSHPNHEKLLGDSDVDKNHL